MDIATYECVLTSITKYTYILCVLSSLYLHVRYKCEKGYYIYNIGVLTVNIEYMCRGLETGERRAFSESFHPFRAESHTLNIYCQYPNIVFILQ